MSVPILLTPPGQSGEAIPKEMSMHINSVFLFDLDGTLVDSVYQHVLAWKEALDQEGSSSRSGASTAGSA